MKQQCECEHSSHFDDPTTHGYSASFNWTEIDGRRTVFGMFQLCAACREAGHMGPYAGTAALTMNGTFECAFCSQPFDNELNPCINDDGYYDDGSHDGGECFHCYARRVGLTKAMIALRDHYRALYSVEGRT